MVNNIIISDSSSDLLTLENGSYASVPLKIITDETEYIDDECLNVDAMIEDLKKYKGKSRSSCPNVSDWKAAFGNADVIFCITITSALSGSCNSASLALAEHLQEHPEKKGHVIDSLSAGPELALIIEKLQTLLASELSFENIVKEIESYKETTHLLFCLESLHNLACNGRVSTASAMFAGMLGIKVVGKASPLGTLELLTKTKGIKKALADTVLNMKKNGFSGGKVRIHYCQSRETAEKLSDLILYEFPSSSVTMQETRGLCSFYAEAGGLLVGYEGIRPLFL